jgi:hypothetical protein
MGRRLLTVQQEQELADELIQRFVDPHEFCSNDMVRELARRKWLEGRTLGLVPQILEEEEEEEAGEAAAGNYEEDEERERREPALEVDNDREISFRSRIRLPRRPVNETLKTMRTQDVMLEVMYEVQVDLLEEDFEDWEDEEHWRDPDYVPEPDENDRDDLVAECPAFSMQWLRRFYRTYGLAQRVPHPQRRPDPNDAEIAAFYSSCQGLFNNTFYRSTCVINVDETSWRVINGNLKTLARVGAEGVAINLESSKKQTMTAIAAISSDGHRFPIWLICKGTTARCERRYRYHPLLQDMVERGELHLTHTKSGWLSEELLINYLAWLHELDSYDNFALIWDQYSAHKKPSVEQAVHENWGEVAYIPAGQTGTYQPLDLRIFGILKATAKALWKNEQLERMLENRTTKLDLSWAANCLVRSWRQISKWAIMDAWSELRKAAGKARA